jgi:hypothetical protein
MGFANPGLALPYNTPAYNPYASFGVNPYTPLGATALPGAAGVGAGTANPYLPLSGAGYDPYTSNPYYSPLSYGGNSQGLTLMGAADVMRSYGNVITSQEQARLLREQYNQAQLETAKKDFDLKMYIKANTPSYSEEQDRMAKDTLKRIQNHSNPVEVSGGKSLNYLLDDVRKHRGKDFNFGKIDLPEDILKQINVTTGNNSLGVLRDGGKLNWPTALLDLVPTETRKDMEALAKNAVQNAAKGQVDRNALKDLDTQVEVIRNDLLKKANDIPTPQYLEAKRFLNDLDEARVAINSGEAKAQFDYQALVSDGKIRDINDLITQMVNRGWRFAPATHMDEAAYRAYVDTL